MSHDPLLDALSNLDKPAPPPRLDVRTRRLARRNLGRGWMRYAAWALSLTVAMVCIMYLVVVLSRAAALY